MGVRINEYDYGNNCGLCFPAGFTPKYLMASFSGILPGATYNPAIHDPCPNQIFFLTQVVPFPCTWDVQDGTHWVVFKIQAANTEMRLYDNTGLIHMFEALGLATCTYNFISDFAVGAGRPFYSGQCQISWVPPVDPVSLRNIVEKMGFDPDDEIWVDWWYKNANTMIVRVNRGDDHTTVYAEHDF